MLVSAQAADFLPLNSQPSSLNAVFRLNVCRCGVIWIGKGVTVWIFRFEIALSPANKHFCMPIRLVDKPERGHAEKTNKRGVDLLCGDELAAAGAACRSAGSPACRIATPPACPARRQAGSPRYGRLEVCATKPARASRDRQFIGSGVPSRAQAADGTQSKLPV